MRFKNGLQQIFSRPRLGRQHARLDVSVHASRASFEMTGVQKKSPWSPRPRLSSGTRHAAIQLFHVRRGRSETTISGDPSGGTRLPALRCFCCTSRRSRSAASRPMRPMSKAVKIFLRARGWSPHVFLLPSVPYEGLSGRVRLLVLPRRCVVPSNRTKTHLAQQTTA